MLIPQRGTSVGISYVQCVRLVPHATSMPICVKCIKLYVLVVGFDVLHMNLKEKLKQNSFAYYKGHIVVFY